MLSLYIIVEKAHKAPTISTSTVSTIIRTLDFFEFLIKNRVGRKIDYFYQHDFTKSLYLHLFFSCKTIVSWYFKEFQSFDLLTIIFWF